MSQSEFVLELSHRFHYSNREAIPIQEIASSLTALERMILRSAKVMSSVTSVPIEHCEVFIEDIASGSLTEDIIVKLFFKDQAELDAFLSKINSAIGQNKVVKNALIGALILSVVGYGVYSAVKAMSPVAPTSSVNVNNNVIINIAAKESGLTPESIEKILKGAISDKKSNALDAIDFVRPAKRDPEASISMEGQTVLTIPKEVVADTPTSLKMDVQSTDKFIPDVDVQIRATNLDSNEAGWAALIPPFVTRRVKLVLGDGIQPKDVAGKFIVRADVIVHMKPQGQNKALRPYQITLVTLISE